MISFILSTITVLLIFYLHSKVQEANFNLQKSEIERKLNESIFECNSYKIKNEVLESKITLLEKNQQYMISKFVSVNLNKTT